MLFRKLESTVIICCRCGSGETITDILLTEDYLCHKCQPALLRRNTYLEN